MHALSLGVVAYAVATSGVSAASDAPATPPTVIIVVGAPGTPQYGERFGTAARDWQKAATAGMAEVVTIGLDDEAGQSRAQLQAALSQQKGKPGDLWLVLLGHGTFDGKDARFNLQGEDCTPGDLSQWLAGVERPLRLIATFSSSGAFLKPLSGRGRIVITSTRSGSEENYSRLGEHLARAVGDPVADFDQDGQTSLLEAWLYATRRVSDFYKDEGRLATEHSLLDDNGDGLGTPADFFKGTRVVKKTQNPAAADGLRAHQVHLVPNAGEAHLSAVARAERDAIELEIEALRERKASIPTEEYYRELERLLLQIARLYSAPGDPTAVKPVASGGAVPNEAPASPAATKAQQD